MDPEQTSREGSERGGEAKDIAAIRRSKIFDLPYAAIGR